MSALLLLVLLMGCLEFEEQDVTFAYDAERDRFDVQIVYRGIFASEERKLLWKRGADGIDEADYQLDELLAGRRTFMLSWITVFPFELDEMAENRRDDLLRQTLLARIAIDQGEFFRDEHGRLCGWQRIRIERFTEFVQLFDKYVRRSLVPPDKRDDLLATFELEDEESRARFERALVRPGSMIAHDNGALRWRIPASEVKARAWTRLLAETVEQDAESTRPTRRAEDELRESNREYILMCLRMVGARATADADGIEITIGDSTKREHSYHAGSRRKVTPDNVAPLLAKRRVAIRTDVTDETLRQDFAAFRRW